MLPATVVAADYAGTLDLLDRTEFRVRTTQEVDTVPGFPNNTQTAVGYDLFTQPTIRARVLDRRWDFELSYAPSFTFADLELGFTPTILHIGDTRVGWHDRFVTVTLMQGASYGQLNGAYIAPTSTQQLVPGQPPIVMAAPAPTTVDYLASRTTGSIGVRLDRRNLVTASGEYDVIGGTNAVSRLTVPEQSGPRANATYEYIASRRDQLLTTALFQSTDFLGLQCLPSDGNAAALYSCSPQSRIFQGGEAVRHRITRRASVSLGAGFAASVSRLQTEGPFQTAYYPTGEALLTVDLQRPPEGALGMPAQEGGQATVASTLRVSARLAPLVDIRTGNVYNAAAAEGSFVVPASARLAFHASGGFLQYLPSGSVGAVTLVHSEAEVAYAVDPYVSLALGERGIWQQQIGFGTFVSTYGYLAVTVREPRFTF
jgi:hypothetical protein